jgi:hypothetical protein
LAQCGKKVTQPVLPVGTAAVLEPADLPDPPAGMVYQAWVCSLRQVGINAYLPVYNSVERFRWRSGPFVFTDPASGAPRPKGALFETGHNLFTVDFAQGINPDTVRAVMLKIAEGDTIRFRPATAKLAGLKTLLMTVEPAAETGPDLLIPGAPFLIGAANDSGVIHLSFVVNYRQKEVSARYFMATPDDTTGLLPVNGCCIETTMIARDNESKGIWFGTFDPGKGGRPDTNLANLRIPQGWLWEGWLKKGGVLVSLGRFLRADSADFSNIYSFDTSKIYFDSARTISLPGESFFTNPPFSSVLGATVFLTLKPILAADTNFFALIVFRDSVRQATFDPFQRITINLQKTFLFDNRARFMPVIRAVVQVKE